MILWTNEEIHTFLRKSSAITNFRNFCHLRNRNLYDKSWGYFYDERKRNMLNGLFLSWLMWALTDGGWYLRSPKKLQKDIKEKVAAWEKVVRGEEALIKLKNRTLERARKKAEKMTLEEQKAELERLKKDLGSFGVV